jgi:hypothetical protein
MNLLTVKFLFLIAGLYLIVADYMVMGLICLAIAIGITFIASFALFVMGLVVILMLTGCGSFVKTENIYIDNSAVNNYVGNPCGFYLGDRCLVWKDGRMARNSDNPYKGNK